MAIQTINTVQTLRLGEITIEVVHKDIKNIHLSVHPPQGSVRIAAPLRMNLEPIRLFAIAKLPWIKQQQEKFRNQARETPREYCDRESHYLWGKRHLLNIIETDASPHLELHPDKLLLQIPPDAEVEKKRAIVDAFYRQQLKQAIPPLIAKWERLMQVEVAGFTVRKMKTKWGSCSPDSRTIRLNLELAKKSAEYLEYVIVHEMVHFLEPTHNQRFVTLMNQFLPKWRFYQAELNRLPISYGSS